eukprot:546461-Prymnesium_polylepis.1
MAHPYTCPLSCYHAHMTRCSRAHGRGAHTAIAHAHKTAVHALTTSHAHTAVARAHTAIGTHTIARAHSAVAHAHAAFHSPRSHGPSAAGAAVLQVVRGAAREVLFGRRAARLLRRDLHEPQQVLALQGTPPRRACRPPTALDMPARDAQCRAQKLIPHADAPCNPTLPRPPLSVHPTPLSTDATHASRSSTCARVRFSRATSPRPPTTRRAPSSSRRRAATTRSTRRPLRTACPACSRSRSTSLRPSAREPPLEDH